MVLCGTARSGMAGTGLVRQCGVRYGEVVRGLEGLGSVKSGRVRFGVALSRYGKVRFGEGFTKI